MADKKNQIREGLDVALAAERHAASNRARRPRRSLLTASERAILRSLRQIPGFKSLSESFDRVALYEFMTENLALAPSQCDVLSRKIVKMTEKGLLNLSKGTIKRQAIREDDMGASCAPEHEGEELSMYGRDGKTGKPAPKGDADQGADQEEDHGDDSETADHGYEKEKANPVESLIRAIKNPHVRAKVVSAVFGLSEEDDGTGAPGAEDDKVKHSGDPDIKTEDDDPDAQLEDEGEPDPDMKMEDDGESDPDIKTEDDDAGEPDPDMKAEDEGDGEPDDRFGGGVQNQESFIREDDDLPFQEDDDEDVLMDEDDEEDTIEPPMAEDDDEEDLPPASMGEDEDEDDLPMGEDGNDPPAEQPQDADANGSSLDEDEDGEGVDTELQDDHADDINDLSYETEGDPDMDVSEDDLSLDNETPDAENHPDYDDIENVDQDGQLNVGKAHAALKERKRRVKVTKAEARAIRTLARCGIAEGSKAWQKLYTGLLIKFSRARK